MIYTTIMRLLFPPISLLLALGIPIANGFTLPQQTTAPSGGITNQNTFDSTLQRKLLYTSYASPTISTSSTIPISTTKSTALYAKKKKGNKKLANAKDAALAALEAIEAQENAASTPDNNNTPAAQTSVATLDFLEDEPLSKKEQMALQKKQQKEAKKQQKEQERLAKEEKDEIEKNKRKKALKALAEMEAAEKNAGSVNTDDSGADGIDGGGIDGDAPLSKKEQKMAMKKAAKDAEKLEKKAKKKRAKQLGITVAELEQRELANGSEDVDEFALVDPGDVNGVNGAAVADKGVGDATATSDSPTQTQEPPKKKEKKQKLTAEERIRKERPPPRIRIMESSQPDYTALRLENIAITFRDQPVLKSATWGVQTGDRIGLVGANGAGKTTQLRILSGELEPTAGDVIKSTKDLRVAMLRQEFIDEIVLTRTLREEFMSVFVEENSIMEELAAAEKELEGMSGDANDAEKMQEVLDRMQKLQCKADAKNVNALGARVSKIMDLMGFEQEEGEYEVNMFSGGWKMRIGLGKVLLQGKLDM